MVRLAKRLVAATLLLAAPGRVAGWTPETQRVIAGEAARLTPPDLYRQLVRHRSVFHEGVVAPFEDRLAVHHAKNDDGSGQLDAAVTIAVENAIRAIESHQPFSEIVYRMGVAAHYVADANNPLSTSDGDPHEARYFADFLAYLESAEPRIQLVFYGFRPELEGDGLVPTVVEEALHRSRALYPMVGREYRRVGFRRGRDAFDDRSTAYGVGAIAFSHAVSDIAQVLRYIWLTAGGIDTRERLPARGEPLTLVPRASTR